MAQRVTTRVIHTIDIDLQDDVLAKIESGDEVEVRFNYRGETTSVKRLTFRDTDRILNPRNPKY